MRVPSCRRTAPGRHRHRSDRGAGGPRRAPVAARRGLSLRPRGLAPRRRPAGRLLRPAGRRPHRRDPRPGLPHQRRALLLQGIRQARGRSRAREGARRRVDGARLRADGLDRRELLPHRALPLRRGGPRPRRPPRRRGDRRDRGGGAQPAARRRDDRCGQATDVLRRDHRRGFPRGARPGDQGARRPRQEPSLRRPLVDRQRAGDDIGGVPRVLRAAAGPHARAGPLAPGGRRQHVPGAGRTGAGSATSATW